MSTIFDSKGAPTLGLNDAKLGTWNGDGTYGSLVDIPSVQLMNTTIKVQSAQLEGDDQITAVDSRVIGGTCKIRFGSLSLSAAVILFGISLSNYGTTPTAQSSLVVPGGKKLPYFGLSGKALASEGGGDLHVFLPKCIIMDDVDFGSLEYGKFTVTELTVYAVADGNFNLINYIEHETARAIAMPPFGF